MATVAAVVIFVAAMLAGMAWFSPGHSSAESPNGGATPPVTSPAATPTPDGTTGLSDVTAPSPTAPQPGGDEDENEPDENEN